MYSEIDEEQTLSGLENVCYSPIRHALTQRSMLYPIRNAFSLGPHKFVVYTYPHGIVNRDKDIAVLKTFVWG